MNRENLKIAVIMLFFAGTALFMSCESGDDLEVIDPITLQEAKDLIDLANLSDDLADLEEDLLAEDIFSSKETAAKSGNGNSCKTRTVERDGDKKIVTIVMDGCTNKNGKKMSGTIVMTFDHDKDEASFEIKIEYEKFVVGGKTVKGEKTIFRTRENNDGFPEWTKSFEITVTFEDGTEIKREGTKTRVMIEGSDTEEKEDDVFSITGSWESTNKDGVKKEVEIVEPLIRKYGCPYFQEGIVKIERGDLEGTIDFGYVGDGVDEDCDGFAEFTDSEGNSTVIDLSEKD